MKYTTTLSKAGKSGLLADVIDMPDSVTVAGSAIDHSHSIHDLEFSAPNFTLMRHAPPNVQSIGAAPKDHSHTPGDVHGLALVALTGRFSDIQGTPKVPTSADDVGAAPVDHYHDVKSLQGTHPFLFSGNYRDLNDVPDSIPQTASDINAASRSHTHALEDISNVPELAVTGDHALLSLRPQSVSNAEAIGAAEHNHTHHVDTIIPMVPTAVTTGQFQNLRDAPAVPFSSAAAESSTSAALPNRIFSGWSTTWGLNAYERYSEYSRNEHFTTPMVPNVLPNGSIAFEPEWLRVDLRERPDIDLTPIPTIIPAGDSIWCEQHSAPIKEDSLHDGSITSIGERGNRTVQRSYETAELIIPKYNALNATGFGVVYEVNVWEYGAVGHVPLATIDIGASAPFIISSNQNELYVNTFSTGLQLRVGHRTRIAVSCSLSRQTTTILCEGHVTIVTPSVSQLTKPPTVAQIGLPLNASWSRFRAWSRPLTMDEMRLEEHAISPSISERLHMYRFHDSLHDLSGGACDVIVEDYDASSQLIQQTSSGLKFCKGNGRQVARVPRVMLDRARRLRIDFEYTTHSGSGGGTLLYCERWSIIVDKKKSCLVYRASGKDTCISQPLRARRNELVVDSRGSWHNGAFKVSSRLNLYSTNSPDLWIGGRGTTGGDLVIRELDIW